MAGIKTLTFVYDTGAKLSFNFKPVFEADLRTNRAKDRAEEIRGNGGTPKSYILASSSAFFGHADLLVDLSTNTASVFWRGEEYAGTAERDEVSALRSAAEVVKAAFDEQLPLLRRV